MRVPIWDDANRPLVQVTHAGKQASKPDGIAHGKDVQCHLHLNPNWSHKTLKKYKKKFGVWLVNTHSDLFYLDIHNLCWDSPLPLVQH